MKERIIASLMGFSSEKLPNELEGMFKMIAEETNLSAEEIRTRSKAILKYLLHHYAQFSVETIDQFNHRLIRTFAKDLNLATNFEVRIDTKELISQAVDQLINRAGEDEAITKILVEFALQKTDEDKSWDIALDLKNTAKLLVNENEARHLNRLKEKTLDEFLSLRKELRKRKVAVSEEISETAEQVLSRFTSEGIPLDVFPRETLPNHFKKLVEGNYDVYKNKLQENIELGGKKLYKATTPSEVASNIDLLQSFILDSYLLCKSKVYELELIKNILKNLVPLATINLVQQELQIIKEEENILPISEFNALINAEIKDQPTPFIYERLGDRYRHFFIDEFQDTSALQWNNLVPLIDNALSIGYEDGPAGSLLVVGDAKQSIYRWRGGLPEQFISLYNKEHPFFIADEHITEVNLETNYRSSEQIIDFNNTFFSYVSGHFGDQTHKELYQLGNRQKHNSKKDGYVQIEFVEWDTKEEAHSIYPQKVLETIQEVLRLDFELKDVSVLVRSKKDGIAISEFLMEHEVPVISDETLLIMNSPLVKCLVLVIHLNVNPNNEEAKIQFLEFLFDHLSVKQPQHEFFHSLIKEPIQSISDKLEEHQIQFSFEHLQFLSLYESCEYIIEKLQLAPKADVFLSSFMELVFQFSQRPEVGKTEFLEYWEVEREKQSIAVSKSTNAISIMTIHKSKGLEFPVVIFPYADVDMYREIEPTTWYPWKQGGFDELLINYKNEVANYGPLGEGIVEQRRNTLELDNLNILYVALTRAAQHLYVFAQSKTLGKEVKTYNDLLKGYLQHIGVWVDGQLTYSFGNFHKTPSASNKETPVQAVKMSYTVSSPQSHQIKLVPSAGMVHADETLQSIRIGNLLHDTMAKIKVATEVKMVLEELKEELVNDPDTFGEIELMVNNIVNHPQLNPLFQVSEEVHNERDIITPQQIIRPDRINLFPDKTATIVDYKTGEIKEQYAIQISGYAAALQDMGYQIREKLLVYCNGQEIIINKA